MDFKYYREPSPGTPTEPKWIPVRKGKDGEVYGDARIADTSLPRLQRRLKGKFIDDDPIVGWTAVEFGVIHPQTLANLLTILHQWVYTHHREEFQWTEPNGIAFLLQSATISS